MSGREWFFVSDLHLGSAGSARDTDRAVVSFLDQDVLPEATPHRTLVLLGDTFDLHGPVRVPLSAVLARLRELAALHQPVVEALHRCLEAGVGIEVVGGNHDIELTTPALASELTRLLRPRGGGGRLRFYPWLLHEPGVFYAEHGNQHYALNRLPAILAARAGTPGDCLPVTPLGAAHAATPWSRPQSPAGVRVVRALLEARRQEALRSAAWYEAAALAEARLVSLDPVVLADLGGLSRFRMAAALTGAVRRQCERRLGYSRPSPLLERAAQVHRTMVRHGRAAGTYVFGHDHRAAREPLPVNPPAVYLNCGTWSDQVRGEGPDRDVRSQFPFVRLREEHAGPVVSELGWHTPGVAAHV